MKNFLVIIVRDFYGDAKIDFFPITAINEREARGWAYETGQKMIEKHSIDHLTVKVIEMKQDINYLSIG